MGKVIITEFVSLDGIAEDPGGSRSLAKRPVSSYRWNNFGSG